MKYGLLLGRFQPFHIAHEAIVHEIINDGLEPIIILGSRNVINEKNPYTVSQRINMITSVFPDVTLSLSEDCDDWNEWLNKLINNAPNKRIRDMLLDKSEIVWYINNKESDRTYFEFNGKIYNNQFYTQIFKDLGYQVKEATYPSKLKLDISATSIRQNLEENKHYLHSSVYSYIKGLQDAKNEISYFR